MYKKKALIPLAIVLFLTGAAAAQLMPSEATDTGLGGGNSITGTIILSTGGRIERRISIRLQTMTKGDRVASTDDHGFFAFRGLVSGDYTLVIDKEKDFEPVSQTVSVMQIRGFPPTQINLSIRLTPKSTAPPKPAVVDALTIGLSEHGKELYAKAQELSKAGDHAGAIEQLLLLTSDSPNFMLGFNELGVEYLKTNALEKADAAFQSATKLAPEAFAPQMNRGIALVSLRKFAEAEAILQGVKKMDEKHAAARYFLGQALANLGRFDEAEKELTAAIAMGGSEMAEAHRILAIIYSSRGNRKQAIDELQTYLQLNPAASDAEQLKKVLEKWKGETS